MKVQLSTLPIIVLLAISGWQCRGGLSDQNQSEPQVRQDSTNQNTGFENEAQEYESPDRVIWQKPDLVIQLLGEVEGKTIADLGAGTGYFSRRLASKGARVIAIDIDPAAIQWMKEQKKRFPEELQDKLIIRQAEPNDPHLGTNEVDMVLLVNTYSYIQNRVTYFTNLQKSIRKGGTVLIIDFKKKETPFGPDIKDRLDVHTVENELIQAGYRLINTDETALDYQYIIKASRP